MQESSPVSRCLNCDAVLGGRFCHQCGQKQSAGDDRHLRRLIGEWTSAITSLDGKLLVSVSKLLIRPGQLTRAYIDGRRVQYTSPITLFLLANLLYFFAPVLSDFSLSFWEQYNVQLYSGLSKALIDAKLAGSAMAMNVYEPQFNVQSNNLAKTLIIVNVPVFAGFLSLIQGRNNRILYADSLIFALHFYAFLLVLMTLLPAIGGVLGGVVHWAVGEAASWQNMYQLGSVAALGLLVIYLGIALAGAFSWGRLRTALSVPVCLVAVFVANQVNRFVLLLVTLATT